MKTRQVVAKVGRGVLIAFRGGALNDRGVSFFERVQRFKNQITREVSNRTS
jgi:hypothetical protein